MEEQIKVTEKQEVSRTYKLIVYFFIYAFIGWCLETIYAFTIYGSFVKRGFLLGPICPIYGFGALLLIINLKNIKNNNLIKFLVSMMIFSIFEFFVSWIMEVLFNQRWWDYSNHFMNIQGRICLVFSLIWGIIGVLFSNVIHPWIEKKIQNISKKVSIQTQKILIYSIMLVYIVDTTVSIILNIKI